ncbi:MAG: hypothetical protein U0R19_38050 [Bryobacteraceae bacterium]
MRRNTGNFICRLPNRRWAALVGLCCLTASLGEAQISGLGVLGTTSTQAILTYTTTSPNPCSIEVSQSPTYAPLVHDVNPVYFPGANLDSRSDSIIAGQQRVIVVGARRVDSAVSGARYSRALQADTDHYFRINCSGSTETGTFHTTTIPFGDTRGVLQQVDPGTPLRYFSPSTSPLVNPEVIDPSTGTLLQFVPVENWAYGAATTTTFREASGNWLPSSGSLGNALSATDGVYAEYGASGQDPLWVRLGGDRYPANSTFSTSLSFQNLYLTGRCTGSGCATGGVIEICFVRDIAGTTAAWSDCNPGTVSVTLSGSDTAITVCSNAPCSSPERPGDFIQFDKPPVDDTAMSRGRVYTRAGETGTLYFTELNDCTRLVSGESISVYHSPSQSQLAATIVSTSCGASTPMAAVQWSSNTDLSYNGSEGVPFFYSIGIRGNPRYGVLIRRKNPAADAALRIDQLQWRAASHIAVNMATGSGGFGKRCTRKATSEGFYHCQAGPMIIGIRPEPLEIRFLGVNYVFGQSMPPAENGFRSCGEGLNDFLWDEDDPNVFYCLSPSNYPQLGSLPGGRPILFKMRYTGNDIACGADGSSCPAARKDGGEFDRWPRLPLQHELLTPCLGGCTRMEDDFTLYGQMLRLDPTYQLAVFPGCEASAVQGSTIVMNCRSGSQDSPVWAFALDIGNGKPVGAGFQGSVGGNTQQIFGSNPYFKRPRGRWCGLHTYQSPVDGDFAVFETADTKCQFIVTATTPLAQCSRSGNGTCDPCPNIVFDGVSYNGRNWCSTVQVTSSWDASWGAAPPDFSPGDPVNPNLKTECPMRYLQKVQPGDYFHSSGERLRVIQMVNATTWIVERGIGNDQTINNPRRIAAGSTWGTACGAVPARGDQVNTDVFFGFQWHYKLDPFATGVDNTAFGTPYINHAWHRGIYRGNPIYSIQIIDPTVPESMHGDGGTVYLPLPSAFAGKVAPCYGNGCERHPSANQNTRLGDSSFFADVNPLLIIGSGANAVTPVTGNLFRFRGIFSVDPKHLPTVAFTGRFPLRNVSAPGVVLSGGREDHGKLCVASVAGECHPSSSTGEVFFNLSNYDRSMPFCREALFGMFQGDICIGNLNGVAAATTQWLLPTGPEPQSFTNMEVGRVVRRVFQTYREAATENVKIDPTGRYYFLRSNALLKLPSLPAVDSLRRSTFLPMQFTLNPPQGTDNVIAEFGYNPEFYCSENRAERCIAFRNSVDEANPYRYPSEPGGEAGIQGVSCSSATCAITIPALSNRVLYWRVKYRNSANAVIGVGGTQATAVP